MLDFEKTGFFRLRNTSSVVHNDHLQHYTRSKRQLSDEETESVKRNEVIKAWNHQIQGLDTLSYSDADDVESGYDYAEFGYDEQDFAEEEEVRTFTFVNVLQLILQLC